ncbi:MAG: carboxypeptidase-like regulatory domain-containing protein [Planctomycetota bacterium]
MKTLFPELRSLRPAATVHQEIDEELQFHFDALVEEFESDGMSTDEATEKAVAHFGSLQFYDQQCRDIAFADRWSVSSGSLAVCLAVIVGCGLLASVLAWRSANQESQIANLQSRVDELNSRLVEMPAKHIAREIKGTIVDVDDKPIRDVDVMVTVKTWPQGMYSQVEHLTKTDVNGRFVLRDKLPEFGDYEIHVAVSHEGLAFQSQYLDALKPGEHDSPYHFFDFQLAPSATRKIQLLDEAGTPLSNALVIPSQRFAADGRQHTIYMQSSQPVRQKTDDQGYFRLKNFGEGDGAEIIVSLANGWEEAISFEADQAPVNIRVNTRSHVVLKK